MIDLCRPLALSALLFALATAASAQGSFSSSASRTEDGVTTTTERSGTFEGRPPADIQARIDRVRDRTERATRTERNRARSVMERTRSVSRSVTISR
jgi:hypothetical protein